MPPVLSSSTSTMSRPEPVIGTPRPLTTSPTAPPNTPPTTPPTTPPMSSPSSPSGAFDKFLYHYGKRGSALEEPRTSKVTQPADSQESIMSPKERIRAEKRAEVCAEAAEWEEIRRREKESKSRTDSPSQASMTTQEEMPPPPPPPPSAPSCPPPAAANAPPLISFVTKTNTSTPAIANVSQPPVAQPKSIPEPAAVVDGLIASVARELRSENLSNPNMSDTTPVPSMPSIRDATVQLATVPAAVQQQQVAPKLSPTHMLPSALVIPKDSMSAIPSTPISRSSNNSTSVAAATARTLATETDEFLNKAGADQSCANDLTEEQDQLVPEVPEPGSDSPKPRSGAYAHVPDPTPFSATPSEEEIAAIRALQQSRSTKVQAEVNINQERSIVKSSLHNSGVKTLELLIESASGEMNLENGFSFDVVMNNTLPGFFSFYAAVSQAPLESFQQLIFTPAWPNCSTARATKQMGELGFKKLKKVIQAWYKQAQKADPEEMDFQIMVSMG